MSVVLTDLDPATLSQSNDPSAITLMRVGLTDYQVAVSIIRNINFSALSPISSPLASDAMLLNRIVAGNPTNYQTPFSSVGFVKNTNCWFYQFNAPTGWAILTGLGDSLLAVAEKNPPGMVTKSYAGKFGGSPSAGSWQQTGTALTLTQIPNHNHFTAFGRTQSNVSATYTYGAQSPPEAGNPVFGTDPKNNPGRGMVGGKGDNATHDNYGQCDTHNHGNTWRPQANVGIIAYKIN